MRLSVLGLLLNEFERETYRAQLSDEDRRRRDKRIPRCALRTFADSPWLFMYLSRNDQALLNMTGCDRAAFDDILLVFTPYWNAFVMDKEGNIVRRKKGMDNGHPRHLNSVGGLGLVLTWFRTKGARSRNLAMNFGLTGTPLTNWLWFSMCCLRSALTCHPKAKICAPTPAEVDIYKTAISSRYPALPDVWCAVDGCKLRVAESQDWYEQITNYNGWTHGHYVNCVFTFAPDGKIRICVLNCPGSWHDSSQSDYGIYEQLEAIHEETGGQVVVDSAFRIATGSNGNDIFIKSSQDDPDGPERIVVNRDATSVRQLSEWGMRMIQAQFPRLTDVLPKEAWRRQAILHLAVLIYNFTTSDVGINQILNTFMYDEEGFHLGRRIEPWNDI